MTIENNGIRAPQPVRRLREQNHPPVSSLRCILSRPSLLAACCGSANPTDSRSVASKARGLMEDASNVIDDYGIDIALLAPGRPLPGFVHEKRGYLRSAYPLRRGVWEIEWAVFDRL